MIRKILALIFIVAVVYAAHLLTKEKEMPVYTDTPTEQEQHQIEQEQIIPDAAPENEMELISPEDAEKDQ